MSLDIHTAVLTAVILAILGTLLSLWSGIRSIRKAHTLRFFRLRRERIVRGWRLVFFSIILGLGALIVYRFAEPIAYSYFPPTPTKTLTPTITLTPSITTTPTITLTPTDTLTPSISDTPTFTPTPHMPLAIESQFESTLTPNPDAVFSDLIFTQGIDEDNYQPLNPGSVFQNPLGHMYALFTYDGMVPGSQWTSLWYRGNELVFFETKPWDGGTGGFGYTDWNPDPSGWFPGEYEVQIFVGIIWKVSGRFTVEGEPPTAIPTSTPTFTHTPSPTSTQTSPPTSTRTPVPTPTAPTPTLSPTPTNTRIPTATPVTPSPTFTRQPSSTPTITSSPTPTATPRTPTATYTRLPSPTPTTMTPTITRRPTHTPTITPTWTLTYTPITPTSTYTRLPYPTPTTLTPTITRHPTLTPTP